MRGLLHLDRSLYRTRLTTRFEPIRRPYALDSRSLLRHEKHKSQLPDTPARTRFAPSPTGYLHLGGLRTALYNYLLAKATGGQFLLRIEDTDQSRLVSDAEEALYRDLKWAGLQWDEGPDVGGPVGPYRQSERLSMYHDHANTLLESGHAFRCFCSAEALLQHQQYCRDTNQPMTYPGTCRSLSPEESTERAAKGEPHTIRFNINTVDSVPVFRDMVYGVYKRNDVQDSRILIKTDGFPTYHFANVVDDHLMNITHVIRGAEWLVTTPFHVSLYQAFGWPHPEFSHVCLLTDMNRQKLSKRNHDIGVASYRSRGIMSTALLNFSALLGWHPGKNSEVMDLEEMVQRFAPKFTKGDAIVDFGKLAFFQNNHIMLANSSVPPKKDLLRIPFTQPVLALIPEFSKAGEIVVSDDEPAPMSKLPQKHLPPIPLGKLMSPNNQLEDKVLDILRADNQPYQSPSRFLHRHAYLLWRIPRSRLQWEYERFREMFASILEPAAGTTEEENTWDEVTIRDVITKLRDNLATLPDGAWVAGSGHELKMDVIKKWVTLYDFMETGQYPKAFKWGWKALRWVLAGSAEGPSVVHILLVLGKDETMRRFDEALAVISEGEAESGA